MVKHLTEEYNAKILIMSATLPQFIEKLFEDIFNAEKIEGDTEEIDKYTRHKLNIIDGDIIEVVDRVKDNGLYLIYRNLSLKKPVLFACNTVDRAIDVYKTLRSKGLNGFLIHGRFTYGDRMKKEDLVMKNLSTVDFVVATQVIEVSLDISFNSILSEPAPIDALIQRFGRVNRSGWKRGIIRDVYILTTGSQNDKYVYDKKLIKRTLEVLAEYDGFELRESKIKSIIDKVYSPFESDKIKEIENHKTNVLKIFEEQKPLQRSMNEEAFHSLFEGMEVIPIDFIEEAKKLIDLHRGIELHKLFVPMRNSTHESLKYKFGREILIHERYKNHHLVFANLKYSEEYGLLKEIKNNKNKKNII